MAGLTKVAAGGVADNAVTAGTYADNSITGDHLNHTTALPDGVTATTQSSGDNSTKVATTAYADAAGTNLDAAVTINESGNAVDFRVESDGNANALLVDGTNNRVGVGCAPGHPFEVRAGANTHVVCVSNTNGNDVIRLTSQASSGDAEIIGFENSASGTHAEKFKINSSGQTHFSGGNVGIGTTDPDSLLELNAAAGTKAGISLGAAGDSITASRYIGICNSTDQTDLSTDSGFSGIEFGGPSSTDEGYLAFHTHDSGVASGERMNIAKNGRTVFASENCTTDFTSALNAYEFRLNTGNHSNVGSMMLRSEDALNASGDTVRFIVDDGNRSASIGVLRSAAGNKCGMVNLVTDDGVNGFLWVDNNDVLRISNTNTVLGSTGGTVVGSQTSDSRLKNSVTDYAGGLALVEQLRPVSFKYNNDPDERVRAGFIAQEVQSVIPESVYDTKVKPNEDESADNLLAMQYVEIIPALVNSIKELKAEVDTLKTKVAALEAG